MNHDATTDAAYDVQGNGVIELWSDVEVNDGGWHEVRAQFNPSYMEVTVDGRKKSHRPELRDNRHIDLSGLLYFGGIEAVKRSRAVSQGVTAAQAAPVGQLGGLRGCLSQLELDGRRIGLPEVLETNSIEAGCLWQYPCEYILSLPLFSQSSDTLIPNNREGMTKLFSVKSIDNFCTNLVQKYSTMCGISVCVS